MTAGRRTILAAALVLTSCKSSDVPASTSTSAKPTMSCTAAIDAVGAFVDAHPDGPLTLEKAATDRLAEMVSDVERHCDPDRLAGFGAEVLEPWSAHRTAGPSVSAVAEGTTTVPLQPGD